MPLSAPRLCVATPVRARFIAILVAILAAISSGAARSQPVAPMPSSAVAAEERLAHISIVTLGESNAPPVVLIPGLASPRSVWDGVSPELARRHRVILVQINGFAGDEPGGNLAPGIIDGVTAELADWLSRHHTAAVPVIGHSLGGLIALKLAESHPERVSQAMVVDALPFFGVLTPAGPTATASTVEPMARMMRDAVAATHGAPRNPAAAEAQVRRLVLRDTALAQVRDWTLAADQRVVAQAIYEDMITDLRPRLPAIAAPITLIVPWHAGMGRDQAAVEAFYRTQYAGTPELRVEMVPDAAHFVMLDQPERFAALVDSFLSPRGAR